MKLCNLSLLVGGIALFGPLAVQSGLAQNTVPKFLNPIQELDTNARNHQSSTPPAGESYLDAWWKGKGATANWLGLGKKTWDYGLSIAGDWQGNYYGGVVGGIKSGGSSDFDEQVKLGFTYDFGKVFGLTGLKAFSNLRYRDGSDPNGSADTANGFNPSNIQSGKELRLMAQYLEYTTTSGKLMINAGWMNPYDQFLQQPLSKLFMNNQIVSNKGIGANMGGGANQFRPGNARYNGNAASKIPWSSSYNTWGGTLRVKPTKATYVMSGLYMAIPNAPGAVQSDYTAVQVAPYTSVPGSQLGAPNPKSHGTINNNGVASFGGAGWNAVGAGQPNGNTGNPNGLYSVTEVGWEPKFGKDKLEGKYAFGMIWWGIQNQDYLPVNQSGSGKSAKAYNAGPFNMGAWAFYWQADQMLYRVHETEQTTFSADGKSVVDAKNPTEVAKPTLSKKGLYMFNAFSFSPQQYSLLDFYYQTGLVYQGLIPGRPEDRMGLALGTAWFSSQAASAYNQTYAINTAATQAANASLAKGKTPTTIYPAQPQPTWGGVLEFDYQIMINKWMSVKPFAQYIMNPQQNGTLGNELVLGSQVALKF